MTAAGRPIPGGCKVFLAEKGITVPTEQVDLGKLAHKSPAYTAINPLQRVPALVLDDGTVISEVDRDLPLFRAAAARAAAVRRRRQGNGGGRDVEAAGRIPSARAGLACVPQLASRHEGDGGAAGAGLGRGEQAARDGFSRACSTASLKDRRFIAGDHYTRGRHHRAGRGGFHEAGQARRAGGPDQPQTLARRRVGAAEREGLKCG